MIQADLLVVNKVDLAPHVGADLGLMARDLSVVRPGPVIYTDCRRDEGIDAVVRWLLAVARESSHRTVAEPEHAHV